MSYIFDKSGMTNKLNIFGKWFLKVYKVRFSYPSVTKKSKSFQNIF